MFGNQNTIQLSIPSVLFWVCLSTPFQKKMHCSNALIQQRYDWYQRLKNSD